MFAHHVKINPFGFIVNLRCSQKYYWRQPFFYSDSLKLDMKKVKRYDVYTSFADLAHLVERHLAKVEVAGSSPVIRSTFPSDFVCGDFLLSFFVKISIALAEVY